MATTPEAAIQDLWAESGALQAIVVSARVYTGNAPDDMDTDAPRVEIRPATQTLVESTGTGGRVVTHSVSVVIRSARFDQARAAAVLIDAYLDSAILPLDGWMGTWSVAGSATDEGDGIWAVQIDLEIMQQK